MPAIAANLILFKVVWALNLYGAVTNTVWIGGAGLTVFVIWHLYSSKTVKVDLRVAVCASCIGLTLDTLYLRSGLLEYSGQIVGSNFAPVWIVILWFNLSLTLNGCMRWLQTRLRLAAILGLVFGPVSYFGGITIGAATLVGNPFILYPAIGIAWAITLPLLLLLASRRIENVDNAALALS